MNFWLIYGLVKDLKTFDLWSYVKNILNLLYILVNVVNIFALLINNLMSHKVNVISKNICRVTIGSFFTTNLIIICNNYIFF
jgi:hypothetical protein